MDPQRKVWRRQWLPIPAFLPGEIPGTEEPGGLQFMESNRIGHDWAQRKVHDVLSFTEDICEIQKDEVHCISCQRQTSLISDRTRIPTQSVKPCLPGRTLLLSTTSASACAVWTGSVSQPLWASVSFLRPWTSNGTLVLPLESWVLGRNVSLINEWLQKAEFGGGTCL